MAAGVYFAVAVCCRGGGPRAARAAAAGPWLHGGRSCVDQNRRQRTGEGSRRARLDLGAATAEGSVDATRVVKALHGGGRSLLLQRSGRTYVMDRADTAAAAAVAPARFSSFRENAKAGATNKSRAGRRCTLSAACPATVAILMRWGPTRSTIDPTYMSSNSDPRRTRPPTLLTRVKSGAPFAMTQWGRARPTEHQTLPPPGTSTSAKGTCCGESARPAGRAEFQNVGTVLLQHATTVGQPARRTEDEPTVACCWWLPGARARSTHKRRALVAHEPALARDALPGAAAILIPAHALPRPPEDDARPSTFASGRDGRIPADEDADPLGRLPPTIALDGAARPSTELVTVCPTDMAAVVEAARSSPSRASCDTISGLRRWRLRAPTLSDEPPLTLGRSTYADQTVAAERRCCARF